MKLSLFVFIDAYGWELFKKHEILQGFLKQKNPLQTVFGYSSACDPTILTGRQPEEHGHFSFFYYTPEGSPLSTLRPLKYLPEFFTGRGRIRNALSKVTAKALGYTGYFQLYNVPFEHLDILGYSETRDLYEPDGINSGHTTFFDYLRELDIPYHCSDWRCSEEENLQSLEREVEQANIRCAYLYLAAMDGLLHHRGTDSEAIAEKLNWYDQKLKKLINRAAENYDEVDVHLFSDHGMTDVTETCNLMDQVKETGQIFGQDYVAVFDSTMARFWFLNDEAENVIRAQLSQEQRGHWLSEDELAQLGCKFRGKKYGEAFFLLNPGVLLCPSFMGRKPVAGMHGYHPDDADSVAMFASTKSLNNPPQKLSDLYQFMIEEVA